MKLSIFILLALLLAFLSQNESAVYDFNVKTVAAPSDFSDELKLKADLDSEYNQGLMRVTVDANDENGGGIAPADTTTIIAELKNTADPSMLSGDSDDATKQHRDVTEGAGSSIMGSFVGTNLFDGNRKKCFSSEDVALLAARKDFESLIPKDLPQCLLNDKMVNVLMHYFCASNQIVQRMSDNTSKRILEKAFYDTLGGYLRHYIVPVTKVSFYAGKVSLKTVQNVIALYHQCQMFLNTNGNGWRAPIADVLNELSNVKIQPLVVKMSKDDDQPSTCIQLDMTSINNDAEDDQMIVSLPKLDPEDSDGFLGNIWLPFKRKRTYNLRSEKSSGILVKFYETVSRCYHFQSMCQKTYNQKFKAWILENIQVHLSDEQFYPGFGSILKIYENLRRGKKAIIVIEDDATGVEEKADFNAEENEKDAPITEEEEFDMEQLTALGAPKKRQKTNKFKDIENKSKKIESKTDNWFNNFYENAKRERKVCEKQKVTCKPKLKPKCKPKVKPKCKPKGQEAAAQPKPKPSGKEKPTKPPPPAPKGKPPKPEKAKPPPKAKPEPKASGPFFSEATKQRLLQLLYYILLLIVLVLLLWLLFACCKRVKRYIQSRPKKVKPGDSPKKKSLCDRLCCKKKKTKSEETVLIKPTSKSVISGKSATKLSESTSSLFCHPKSKCLPLGSRKAKDVPVKKVSSTSATSASSVSSSGKKPKDKKVKEAKKPKEKEKKPKEKKVKIKSRKSISPCKKRCCRSKERKKSPTSSSASTTPRKSSLKPAKPPPKPTKPPPKVKPVSPTKVKPVSPTKAKPPTPPKKRSKCCSRTPTPPPEKSRLRCFSRSTTPAKASPKTSPKGSPKTTPKSTPRRGRRRGCEMIGMQRNAMSSTDVTK